MTALSPSLTAEFARLTQALDQLAGRLIANGETGEVASEDVARAMTAVVKLYASKAEREGSLPQPFTANSVTPTEAVVVVSEMLRALDISLFDLAMWYRRGERP